LQSSLPNIAVPQSKHKADVVRWLCLVFLCMWWGHAMGQENPVATDTTSATLAAQDTVLAAQDTVVSDTTLTDSLSVPQGPIETTITYFAQDSMVYDVTTGKIFLYNEAKVTYGEMDIEASRIQFDMTENLVSAQYTTDSTGKKVGIPVFKEQEQTYNAEEMTYNIETKRGVIKKIVTQQGDGYILSSKVKKTPEDALFAAGNTYTTCNYEHPHFGIRARKLKILPGEYVIAGPFNLEINDTPTPLGFAFGAFPFSEERAAGVIVPTYGETRERGFYLRNGGFYFPVGDYAGVKLLGQIYSLGGWGASLESQYRLRYKFNGRLSFSYNKVKLRSDDNFENVTTDYWLRWSHSPQTRGSGRFSANVNVGSSSYNRNNSFVTDNFLSASFNSSVSYNKVFEGTPFTFGSSLRINQNVRTEVTQMFPEVNLAMRRIFPFKGPSSKKNNPLAQINFSYNFNARANITNDSVPQINFPFSVFTPARPVVNEPITDPGEPTETALPDFFSNFFDLAADMQYGAVHRIPVSTNITLLKYFQFTPNFNYTEYWYPQKFSYTYVESANAVKVDTIPGFARAYDWNTGVGLNTRLYLFYYPKIKGVQGVRHMITPNVSFSYRPDFSSPDQGFYQPLQTGPNSENVRLFSRFAGALFGQPGLGTSSAMSFGLDNQFEAKVISKPDSTGEVETEKIPILQNLSFRSGYNFAADSFRLSNITFSTRMQLLKNAPYVKGVSVNFNGTVDPYTYEVQSVETLANGRQRISQRRVNKFAWETGNGIGSLSNFSINLSTSFGPENKKKDEKKQENLTEAEQDELEFIENNPDLYVDFNVPWNLRVNYNFRYSKTGFNEARIVQTLDFSGDVSFTEKWKIGFRTSYDFEEGNFGFTSLNLFRDLHCWQFNMSWIPFGPRQSYNIDIAVRSSILQDLKISKRNTWFDRGAF